MNAITIWQPWAWAIAEGFKRVENRVWSPPAAAVGHDLAIHAGLKVDDGDAFAFIGDRVPPGTPRPRRLDLGAVVAVARLRGFVHAAARELVELDAEHERAWFVGPYGWRLENVRRLAEPVPCRGAQRLWTLPAEVEAAVRARLP